MFYVYVLENTKGELYYGFTNDLRRRLTEHNRGRSFSTKGEQWSLVYYEAYRSDKDARTREERLKGHGQAKRQIRDRIKASRRTQS